LSLPQALRAVIFDLDGTLIDSEALVREAYFAAAKQFRIEVTDAQFLSLVGLHRDANDAKMRGYYGADFPLDDFYTATRAFLGDRTATLKPGASELLDALDARRLPYALATSSGRPWVEKHFAAHRLDARFRAVIARGDYTHGKPHPEPYLNAAQALGVAPETALALEDSHAGIAAAHAAGCITIMVPDLLAPNEDSHAKALIVRSLHDVLTLLA
jgi:HAD superfamily hydrolase (TIGR01509 family)